MNQFQSSKAVLLWNKALWLEVPSLHLTNERAAFQRGNATLKFVYDIGSSNILVEELYFQVQNTKVKW